MALPSSFNRQKLISILNQIHSNTVNEFCSILQVLEHYLEFDNRTILSSTEVVKRNVLSTVHPRYDSLHSLLTQKHEFQFQGKFSLESGEDGWLDGSLSVLVLVPFPIKPQFCITFLKLCRYILIDLLPSRRVYRRQIVG